MTIALAAPAAANAQELPAETIEARQHFFGSENVGADGSVRSDRVILSWFSVASLAAAAPRHRSRGISAGSPVGDLEHRYRRSRALGRGLRRAGPGSHIVFGTRAGRVRFVAIADDELVGRPRALRRYLKFAR